MRTAVSQKEIARWPLFAGMMLCFALMGIFWVRVVQLGSFSLEAYHVGLLCIIVATVASLSGPASVFQVLIRVAPWFAAYVGYMLFLLPAVMGTNATGLLLKQGLFLVGFLCVAAYFSTSAGSARSLRAGGLLGIGLYLAFTEYSARLIGQSLFGAVSDFLASGSFKALIYGFFRPVFNSLEDASDPAFVASLTNSISVSLLVLALCYRIGRNRQGIDVTGIGVMVLAVLFGLLLNSRSVVLAAIACMALAFAFRLVVQRGVSFLEVLSWCVGGIVAISAILVIALHKPTALDAITTAFTFEDNSAESRLQQYDWALGLIDERILTGFGYVETESGYPIHNLFLSSWAYTGLGGFLLVLTFYGGLVLMWLKWLWRNLTLRGYWKLDVRAEWVAVLPVLPLFRMWISGAGGLPAFGEWIALAIFVGLTMANERVLSLSEREGSPGARHLHRSARPVYSRDAHRMMRSKSAHV
jgi:hypothetical protein